MVLLLKCLEWWWKDRTDFFAAGNLSIYFSPRQIKSQDFRGPDFFVVLDTERKPRKSWVVWAEGGRYPNVIVEVLSDSTAASDRGEKKRIYQDIFRTPDYFWIDPDTLEFAGFHLVDGLYQAIAPNESGLLWSQQLGLYLGLYERQLRFFTPAVQLVPTPEEAAQQAVQQAEQEAIRAEQESRRAEQETLRAEQESRRAEQETLRAEQESRRAEQETLRAEQEAQRAEQEANRARALSDRLRQLGIDPDTV
jgi:Uma2 family endonuclease